MIWTPSGRPSRERVTGAALAPEVRKMYAAAMKLSPRFAAEFRDFWSLADDFTFKAE